MNVWVENALLLVAATIGIVFNKQFATICQATQRSLWGLDYDLRFFRIPAYLVGVIFLIIAIGRMFF